MFWSVVGTWVVIGSRSTRYPSQIYTKSYQFQAKAKTRDIGQIRIDTPVDGRTGTPRMHTDRDLQEDHKLPRD